MFLKLAYYVIKLIWHSSPKPSLSPLKLGNPITPSYIAVHLLRSYRPCIGRYFFLTQYLNFTDLLENIFSWYVQLIFSKTWNFWQVFSVLLIIFYSITFHNLNIFTISWITVYYIFFSYMNTRNRSISAVQIFLTDYWSQRSEMNVKQTCYFGLKTMNAFEFSIYYQLLCS